MLIPFIIEWRNSMSHFKKILISFLLILSCIFQTTVHASSSYSYVALSDYHVTTQIGDEFYLVALTSTGKKPTWKSSNSKIASVNTYGRVTAKSSGTASITAKIKNAEASCKITVTKTELTLNKSSLSLEHGETFQLTGTTSNHSNITWKSSKKSVAAVSENGLITAYKPGQATITAKANDTKVTCKINVKKPDVRISLTALSLYRKEQRKLSVTVSSNISPVWKSNKKSVVTVNERGLITAVKHGTAIISATVDGVSAKCYITVKQPTIKLSQTKLTMKAGTSHNITADVSSGNSPEWTSSNTAVATVSNGTITALSKGTVSIYASEDGIKTKCSVAVTES